MTLYCGRHKGLSFQAVAGICTPAIPLFHAFGRIGCFFAGCCWGVECEGGLAFPLSIAAPNGVPLFPVQLLEAGCNALLFFFLHKAAGWLRENWLLLPLYLACYGTVRFLLEFLRGDPSRGIWLLSTSQWLALAAIFVGGLYLLCGKAAKKNTNC